MPSIVAGEFTGQVGQGLVGDRAKVLTRSRPYHELSEETGLVMVFHMMTLAFLRIGEAERASFVAGWGGGTGFAGGGCTTIREKGRK